MSFLGGKKKAPAPVLLLENAMDGGARWAAVHGATKSQTRRGGFFPFLSNLLLSAVVRWSVTIWGFSRVKMNTCLSTLPSFSGQLNRCRNILEMKHVNLLSPFRNGEALTFLDSSHWVLPFGVSNPALEDCVNDSRGP